MEGFFATLDEIEKLDWTFLDGTPAKKGKGFWWRVLKEVNLAEATLTAVKVCGKA